MSEELKKPDGWIDWTPGQPRPDGGETVDWINYFGGSGRCKAHELKWGDKQSHDFPVARYRIVTDDTDAADEKARVPTKPATINQQPPGRHPGLNNMNCKNCIHVNVPQDFGFCQTCECFSKWKGIKNQVWQHGYESLSDVLRRAYAQAAGGKGAERHAQGQPFDQQPMQHLISLYGVGFATGQAAKKAQESHRLPRARAVAELLGAINYLAGAVIAIEAKRTHHTD